MRTCLKYLLYFQSFTLENKGQAIFENFQSSGTGANTSGDLRNCTNKDLKKPAKRPGCLHVFKLQHQSETALCS